MATDFFPQRPDAHPMIYAYEDTNPQYQGLLKVDYTLPPLSSVLKYHPILPRLFDFS